MKPSSLTLLRWPKLDIAAPDPSEALAGFSGELRHGSKMTALRERLAQVICELQQTLVTSLDQAVQQVCVQLDTMAGQLQAALTQSLAADLEYLRAALANKTWQVAHLQALAHEFDDKCISQDSK